MDRDNSRSFIARGSWILSSLPRLCPLHVVLDLFIIQTLTMSSIFWTANSRLELTLYIFQQAERMAECVLTSRPGHFQFGQTALDRCKRTKAIASSLKTRNHENTTTKPELLLPGQRSLNGKGDELPKLISVGSPS